MASTIIEFQDLSTDKLLVGASRQTYQEKPVPSLGGIPLIAKLGQGGMGAVYVGMHPRLKQEVAVKVLPYPLLAQQPQLIERFFREAQIAARIKSNHLVSVSDVNEESGMFYIVMEYVNGLSAGAYLKQIHKSGCDGLPELEALEICVAATEGLAAAHAENIVHRDVKPDNILIPRSKQGELLLKSAKLADLGLARGEDSGDSLTGTRTALGTPGFMAPEQCMDAKKAKTAADVFSMGATLYALLACRTPFRGDTPMETVLATLQKPFTPIRQIRQDTSVATDKLINRCLEKEADRRFANAAELLQALKSCRDTVEQARTAPTRPAIMSRSEALQATLIHGPETPQSDAKDLERTLVKSPSPPAPQSAPPPPPRTTPLPRQVAKDESATKFHSRNVELFTAPAKPRKSASAVYAVLGILTIGAGVAWAALTHNDSTPSADPTPTVNPQPVPPVVMDKPKPVIDTVQPKETPTTETTEAKPPPPAVIKIPLTDEQKRQALTEALPAAKKADESSDWTQVVALLNVPVIQLGDLAHPERDAATALLLKARTEVAKRGIFLDKVKQAEALLADKNFEGARVMFNEAKSVCPKSPDLARAIKGIAAATAGLNDALYQAAMSDGNKALDAQNFSDAARAFRRAQEIKPGDQTASDNLRIATAKAAEAAKPKTPPAQQPTQPTQVNGSQPDGPQLPPPPPDQPPGPEGRRPPLPPLRR